MALKPKTLKAIQRAIQRFSAYLRYRAVGPHVLTKAELKDLIRSGMISPSQAPKTAVARSYLLAHSQTVDLTPAPKTTRDGAIDFLERMFSRYADKMGESMASDIQSQLEAQIMPFTDRTEGAAIYGAIKDPQVHAKYLGNVLKDKVDNWAQRWKLIVGTELTRASQYGAMDAILHNNRGTDPDGIRVAKVGPNDAATCAWCRKFWISESGDPKIYRLSELMANGTNIGKHRDDWGPTIDVTHPACRHKLIEVRPGWGFQNGTLTYKGSDHDEFLAQRKGR